MKLSENIILITGGTSGIGYELGKALLKLNNTVILLGRDEEKLNNAQRQGFHTIRCDLADQVDIENAVVKIQNEYSGLNILFNNAGVQFNYLFADTVISFDKIRQEIDVNLTGQAILTQMLIPVLSTAERALIINTTSALGAFPKTDALVYSASKAAMRSFTTGLRYALKSTPVKVLELIPPVTDTGMTAGRDATKMSPEALVAQILPQMAKEKSVLTTPAIRVFLWIAFLFPGMAHKILMKKR